MAPPLFNAEYDDAFEHRPFIVLVPCIVDLPTPAAWTLADRHGSVPPTIGYRLPSAPCTARGRIDGAPLPLLLRRLRQRQKNADQDRTVLDDIIHNPLATPINNGLQILRAWTSTDCNDRSSKQFCAKRRKHQTNVISVDEFG
jgi:hypothetical protein